MLIIIRRREITHASIALGVRIIFFCGIITTRGRVVGSQLLDQVLQVVSRMEDVVKVPIQPLVDIEPRVVDVQHVDVAISEEDRHIPAS